MSSVPSTFLSVSLFRYVGVSVMGTKWECEQGGMLAQGDKEGAITDGFYWRYRAIYI